MPSSHVKPGSHGTQLKSGLLGDCWKPGPQLSHDASLCAPPKVAPHWQTGGKAALQDPCALSAPQFPAVVQEGSWYVYSLNVKPRATRSAADFLMWKDVRPGFSPPYNVLKGTIAKLLSDTGNDTLLKAVTPKKRVSPQLSAIAGPPAIGSQSAINSGAVALPWLR
jgi:hypothetical protein